MYTTYGSHQKLVVNVLIVVPIITPNNPNFKGPAKIIEITIFIAASKTDFHLTCQNSPFVSMKIQLINYKPYPQENKNVTVVDKFRILNSSKLSEEILKIQGR